MNMVRKKGVGGSEKKGGGNYFQGFKLHVAISQNRDYREGWRFAGRRAGHLMNWLEQVLHSIKQ